MGEALLTLVNMMLGQADFAVFQVGFILLFILPPVFFLLHREYLTILFVFFFGGKGKGMLV